jgi:hypothetical protein
MVYGKFFIAQQSDHRFSMTAFAGGCPV